MLLMLKYPEHICRRLARLPFQLNAMQLGQHAKPAQQHWPMHCVEKMFPHVGYMRATLMLHNWLAQHFTLSSTPICIANDKVVDMLASWLVLVPVSLAA